MRGILKSVSGAPVAARRGGAIRADVDVLDGRVEITMVLDPPTSVEIDKLLHDVGRGYYVLSDQPEARS